MQNSNSEYIFLRVVVRSPVRFNGPSAQTRGPLHDDRYLRGPSSRSTGDSWFYAEIKVAFDNMNRGKMVASWRADARALESLAPAAEKHSAASILFCVGRQPDELGHPALTLPSEAARLGVYVTVV